ncbi:MAG: DUF86 domain-containing protein [Oscillospiraceae bacterium]|jgi:uncharacterized protein with HEPN domain|nr:DUF86 domain-containing protein [Oscillospiraceae bacterium]
MSGQKNLDILKRIILYCDEIKEAMNRLGSSYAALKDDSVYKNAVAMCILQIGELTVHLSDEFKAAYSDMPWQDIKNMRNIAAHRYGSFDTEKLWETISEDIPKLRRYCDEIIGERS